MAMSNKTPMLDIDIRGWLQTFRDVTNPTNERTLVTNSIPKSGVSGKAPVVSYGHARAIASALVLGNMNSLPLDWIARSSVGGTSMSFFIVKQLPVLSPEVFLEKSNCDFEWVQLIIPRVLELTYTSNEMSGFAHDLGFQGPPFRWDQERRHRLRCELDGIFAHMYELDRSDLEWILDAPEPSSSFPVLKSKEMKEFGEYRTKRYVLQAFDQLARGQVPTLSLDVTQ